VAALRRHGQYRVESVGLTSAPVSSMGGPIESLSEIDIPDVAVFILPGGDRWETAPVEAPLEALLKRLDSHDVPIAAISATVAISKIGLLRGRATRAMVLITSVHTSRATLKLTTTCIHLQFEIESSLPPVALATWSSRANPSRR